MAREVTPIVLKEDGSETHESWIMMRAGKVTSTPGARLFDSEIPHGHYIVVEINRCTRRRDLNRDWKQATKVLAEVAMSHAQWGAFVSSFGEGGGVPATLQWLDGPVPQAAPAESRLSVSAREVRAAGDKAMAPIAAIHEKLEAAMERGASKREMRELIRDLGIRVGNAPSNMKYAADSLTEHVEKVVTQARSDIEAMVLDAAERGVALDVGSMTLLGSGSAGFENQVTVDEDGNVEQHGDASVFGYQGE